MTWMKKYRIHLLNLWMIKNWKDCVYFGIHFKTTSHFHQCTSGKTWINCNISRGKQGKFSESRLKHVPQGQPESIMFQQEKCRQKRNETTVFSYVKDCFKEEWNKLFSRSASDRTRMSGFKLCQRRLRLDFRKYLIIRVIKQWIYYLGSYRDLFRDL